MAIPRSPKLDDTLPPIRCHSTLILSLVKLSAREGRDFSDYVRRVLEKHCYERSLTVPDEWAPSQFGREQQ